MEFEVTRTSNGFGRHEFDRPCPEAVPRTSEGRRGKVVTRWYIQLDTLDELIALVHERGRIILDEPITKNGSIRIEIYDDYRE